MRYSDSEILSTINKPRHSIDDLDLLISSKALGFIEEMASVSRAITRKRFGNNITLYAPLYISNECVNNCVYCGFNVHSKIKRVNLSIEEIVREAEFLRDEGFGHILLLTGEAPNRISVDYLSEVISIVQKIVPHVSVEVYPMDKSGYKKLGAAGCDAVTVYQETYNREIYKTVHLGGPKSNYDNRYKTPLEAAKAGIKGIGLGFLMGLAPFKDELIALIKHAIEVQKADWRAKLAFSFPRLRPFSGSYEPKYPVSDIEMSRMLFVLRMLFPDAEMVLSTRESPRMRDGLMELGITRMSAGSSTQPGGYSSHDHSGEQFSIDDIRSPDEISKVISQRGLEPVWKDWEYCM